MAVYIDPQQGPQEAFLKSPADIAIYGGAAGGGKTWALLCEASRGIKTSGFYAVIFRRNAVQVRNPGGLWDESMKFFGSRGGTPLQVPMEWVFPSGAKVKFAHLEYDSSVLDWQGSQIPLICFDELTHFSQSQFFYMLSRNRTLERIHPYVRATCNPDAESWVADFISWWIDQDTGLAIAERSGVLRYMVRVNDEIHWAGTSEELEREFPGSMPKSVTFIASKLSDNKILMDADPGYLASLKALPLVERERLLNGNWKIRPQAGLLFKRSWVDVVDAAPAGLRTVRYWDLAATEKTSSNDPDFTATVKMGVSDDGRFYVLHGMSMRRSPHHVEEAIRNLASQDGRECAVCLPQDPGQAGKSQSQSFVRMLAGYDVHARRETGDKPTRFGAFSAQCEGGNVSFVRGDWNEEWFNALESFPDAKHDDHADACSGAFNFLTEARAPMRFNPAVLGEPARPAMGFAFGRRMSI